MEFVASDLAKFLLYSFTGKRMIGWMDLWVKNRR